MGSNEVIFASHQALSASDFMPLMTVEIAVQRKQIINQFIGSVLKEGDDYGEIPGGGKKKVLLKPGAEKLCSLFGLAVTYSEDKIIEDWTGADHGGEPLFYYSYRCQLSRGGMFMGEGIGSCNTWESKYRYRWVSQEVAGLRDDIERLPSRGGSVRKFEPEFALNKKETTGKYGKPIEHWQLFESEIQADRANRTTKNMKGKDYDGWEITIDEKQYRIPNPDVADVINTAQKMGQKRALIAAVLIVTNCSDAFTQDLEDFGEPMAKHEEQHEPEAKPDPKMAVYETSEKPFPTQLLAEYEAIGRASGEARKELFRAACNKMADAMIQSAGKAGNEVYERCRKSIESRFPEGPKKMTDVRVILTELWEAGETLQQDPLTV